MVREAEIKALQAQINPHFLFNAINTVISTIRINPEKAVTLLVKLADFFRSNIKPAVEGVSLATELEHCRSYIAIESARFEERMRMTYDIDQDTLDCLLPPLILQPLVENGLKHGILLLEAGGEITISAQRQQGLVYIEVRDNGVGMSTAKLASLLSETAPASDCEGAGIALKNVNARLIAHFGVEHGLRVESRLGQGTTVAFTVPCP